jgi:hypothetical protein
VGRPDKIIGWSRPGRHLREGSTKTRAVTDGASRTEISGRPYHGLLLEYSMKKKSAKKKKKQLHLSVFGLRSFLVMNSSSLHPFVSSRRIMQRIMLQIIMCMLLSNAQFFEEKLVVNANKSKSGQCTSLSPFSKKNLSCCNILTHSGTHYNL